jgi:hypothetical protein
MESKIVLEESIINTERRFGSNTNYYPAIVTNTDGVEANALFTKDQIDIAIERAERNPEDIAKDQTFWSWLTD